MAAAAVMPSSAAGLLTLLDDENDELKHYALVHLNKVVHEFWFQIASYIGSVEALYEDDEFQDRELAALIASKVFYHLGELDSALTYALGAGAHFNVDEQSEYVQTLIARCLDQYFELRVKQVEQKEAVDVDPRLVAVVERMLDSHGAAAAMGGASMAAGAAVGMAFGYEQAVGVALEGRRLDRLESLVAQAPDKPAVLGYALRVCQKLVVNRDFRQQAKVAKILNKLLSSGSEVQEQLPKLPEPAAAAAAAAEPAAAADGADAADAMDTDAAAPAPAAAAADANGAPPAAAAAPDMAPELVEKLSKLRDILSGKTPIGLNLEFLYHNNKADLQILKNIKGAVDARVSVAHSATILANALMHAGTSIDTFLRENLEWLSRATNWAKFSATAGLGVIHRGQLQQGKALMAPYLPREGHTGSPYSEGGALYALGLITANHGAGTQPFLTEGLRSSSNPIIQHGACLGLGLAALGTNDEEVFEDLKNVLYTDDAVAGEAAGIAMGLLCCGSGSDKAQEMLAYAHDTQHEKIIRGLAMGLALISYGIEEAADTLVEQMAREQDPILRYGAMYVIGLAYRGTGNNGAVQRLLHYAVSDVSDDVRRAAVLCLGFVLMGAPEQCPKIVALLAESFNPHMRYGAAMAVGLACAGTGLREAVSLLESMLGDGTDFVRQGASIALALVLVQQPEAVVEPFRKRLAKSISDKHEEVMARMGSVMAAGILDAGGRNATVALRSGSGYFRRTSVVGLAVFTGYWYWYPLSYFLSLGLAPTAVIGLDSQLRAPKVELACNARPSLFAYPPPVTTETSKEVAKVEKAVLSTTAKARERQKKKDAEKQKGDAAGKAAGMDVDEPAKPAAESDAATAAAAGNSSSGAKEGAAAAAGDDKAEGAAAAGKEKEPSSFSVTAPCRVVPHQVKHMALPQESRWVPVKRGAPLSGILVLRDLTPDEPVEYSSSGTAGGPAAPGAAAAAGAAGAAGQQPQQQEQEAAPPAPFEFAP
ncbi:26S proteasome regulatory complex [Scenedesmus sp. NREL 46B-D3]|nr:26S proteasome regulatory complex [Scenedesmus sp. NREL 46B-D3]